jgi:hypothetical protein
MDAERRFSFRKPPIGKAKGFVVVGDMVRIEHRLLKTPLVVAIEQIASAVRITERGTDDVLLRRDVRRIDLKENQYNETNVALVLKSPVRIERFKFGANQVLTISRRERRSGVDIDIIGLNVEDPDGLITAFSGQRIWIAGTLVNALKTIIGEPTGDEARERRSSLRQRRTFARLKMVGFGVLWTGLIAARLGLGGVTGDAKTSTVIALVASALVWAVVVAAAVVIFSENRIDRTRPVRDRVSGWYGFAVLAGVLAAIAIPFLLAGWMASSLGTPKLFAYGLVAGIPGGFLCGLGMRRTRTAGS